MGKTRRATSASLACAIAATAWVAGCGIGPGDYRVYRVAFAEPAFSGDCGVDEDDSTTFRQGGTFILYLPGTLEDTAMLDADGTVLTGTETDDGFTFQGEDVERDEFGGDTIFDSDHDGLDDFDEDDFVDSDGDGLDDTSFEDTEVDVDGDGLHDLFEDDLVDLDNDGEDDRLVRVGGATLITTVSLSVSLTLKGSTVEGTFTSVSSTTCEGECQGFGDLSCTASSSFDGIEIEDARVSTP